MVRVRRQAFHAVGGEAHVSYPGPAGDGVVKYTHRRSFATADEALAWLADKPFKVCVHAHRWCVYPSGTPGRPGAGPSAFEPADHGSMRPAVR